jgi:hypothetical protein
MFKLNYDLFSKLPKKIQSRILKQFKSDYHFIHEITYSVKEIKQGLEHGYVNWGEGKNGEDLIVRVDWQIEAERIIYGIHGEMIHMKCGDFYWNVYTLEEIGTEWLERAGLTERTNIEKEKVNLGKG